MGKGQNNSKTKLNDASTTIHVPFNEQLWHEKNKEVEYWRNKVYELEEKNKQTHLLKGKVEALTEESSRLVEKLMAEIEKRVQFEQKYYDLARNILVMNNSKTISSHSPHLRATKSVGKGQFPQSCSLDINNGGKMFLSRNSS